MGKRIPHSSSCHLEIYSPLHSSVAIWLRLEDLRTNARAVGRSENLRGSSNPIFFKEEVFASIPAKIGGAIAPLAPHGNGGPEARGA